MDTHTRLEPTAEQTQLGTRLLEEDLGRTGQRSLKLEDTAQLFWVPAHLHPEIAPQEFEAWLQRCNVRVNDAETSSQSELGQLAGESTSYRKLNRRKSSLRREANLTDSTTDNSQPPLRLRANVNSFFEEQAGLFDEDPEITETPAALRSSLTRRVSYISDSECAAETTHRFNSLVRGGSGWRALKRSVRTNRVRRGSDFSEGDLNDVCSGNPIQRNRSDNFTDRRKFNKTKADGSVSPTITLSTFLEERVTGSLGSTSLTEVDHHNDEVLNRSIWTPLSTVPITVKPIQLDSIPSTPLPAGPLSATASTVENKSLTVPPQSIPPTTLNEIIRDEVVCTEGNEHLVKCSASDLSDTRNIPSLPTTSTGSNRDKSPKKEPKPRKTSSWSKLNLPQLVAKMASSNSEKSSNRLKKIDSGIDLGDSCATKTSSECITASGAATQKQRKTTTTAAFVALFSTLSSSKPSKLPTLGSPITAKTVPTSPTSNPASLTLRPNESASSIPPPAIKPYPLRPSNRYSNYNRFPIHVERALYRLSHTKLANARRPLYHQVLISNMMFWYLALISKQQQQQQQQLKLQSETLEAYANSSATTTPPPKEKEQQKIVKDKEKERKRHERQTEQAAKKLSQRVAKQASRDARRRRKEEKGRVKENLKMDTNAAIKGIGSTGNSMERGNILRSGSGAGTMDVCIAPNFKNKAVLSGGPHL